MITCANCQAENPPGSSFCGACGKPLQQPAAAPAGNDFASMQTISPFATIGRKDAKAEAALDLAEGDVFAGRYTIEKLIGRGGMGVVYKAVDRHGDRAVALKLIRPDLLAGEEAVKRLIAEGVTTQELAHKNIVRVYNVDEADGVPYVAMEFVEGTTLAEWHRAKISAREQVPLRTAARIVMAALAGLEAAHEAGVIHRDLKPQNIILTGEPDDNGAELKILDFGIAQAADSDETMSGMALGSAAYMAPEQRTDPDLVDASSDLYALSKIFYKLLMDALPDAMWQPPSASRSDVPEDIDRLIYAGISVSRGGRPASTGEYRDRLLAAMNAGSIPTPAPTPRPTPAPTPTPAPAPGTSFDFGEFMAGPGKFVAIGLGAVLLLVIIISQIPSESGGNGGTVVGGGGTTPPPPPPESPYEKLNGIWYADGSGEGEPFYIEEDGTFVTEGLDETYAVPYTITGQFVGNNANYTYTGQLGVFQGTLSWDGVDCHVVNTLTVNGQTLTERYHINHPPTDDFCPEGF